MERLISAVGMLVLLGLAWLMSNNKRRINMRTVVVGLSTCPRWRATHSTTA